MNLFNKFFPYKNSRQETNPKVQESSAMNAKEKQALFITSYLKPTLKHYGYLTNRQTWWKEHDDFFIIINLQNYSWNTRNDVNFCFNIGIALKKNGNLNKMPSLHDLDVHIRESFYIPEDRNVSIIRNKNGYFINQYSNINGFTSAFKIDLEDEIVPKLNKLITLKDCIDFYGDIPFWGERLKKLVNSKSDPQPEA